MSYEPQLQHLAHISHLLQVASLVQPHFEQLQVLLRMDKPLRCVFWVNDISNPYYR